MKTLNNYLLKITDAMHVKCICIQKFYAYKNINVIIVGSRIICIILYKM